MRAIAVKSFLCLLMTGLLPGTAMAEFLGFGKDENVLWKSGANLYIKLTEQDSSKRTETPPNQHPISLNTERVTQALESLRAYSSGGFFKKDELVPLFSIQQARLLGQYVASGLKVARPDQDVVFVLARSEKKYLVIRDTTFTGGRVFYANGRLHIIVGDYNSEGDRFQARAEQSSGITDTKQYFSVGRRAKESRFKGSIVASDGVEVHTDGDRQRKDWIEVDIATASNSYLAEKRASQPEQTAGSAALEAETARLARERREMRLEMARMRKEMKEAGATGSSGSIEERLLTLKELRDKDLISAEEYEQKRREILGDI